MCGYLTLSCLVGWGVVLLRLCVWLLDTVLSCRLGCGSPTVVCVWLLDTVLYCRLGCGSPTVVCVVT